MKASFHNVDIYILYHQRAMSPIKLLKFDYEKETAYRGPDGHCVQAKPGEFLVLIISCASMHLFQTHQNPADFAHL
jgi:hypothetical protein